LIKKFAIKHFLFAICKKIVDIEREEIVCDKFINIKNLLTLLLLIRLSILAKEI